MAQRFPVSLLLLAGLGAMLFADFRSGDHIFSCNESAATARVSLFGGVIVSLCAALFLEDRLRSWKLHTAVAAIALLWGAYCHLLPHHMSIHNELFPYQSYPYSYSSDGMRQVIGLIVLQDTHIFPEFLRYRFLEPLLIAAGAALLVFAPFCGKGKDTAFGNFYARVCLHVTLAWVISAALKGALELLNRTQPFGLFWGLYLDEASNTLIAGTIFCWALFTPLWIMAYMPDKGAKFDNSAAKHPVLRSLGLRLLVFTLIYAVILYIFYAYTFVAWLKGFEFGWGWTESGISATVSALAAAGLLSIMLIYPVRQYGECMCENKKCAYWHPPAKGSRAMARFSRWFGVAILPLLALMTAEIVIGIRVYGISIMSGYLLIINLWLYGIFAYLFFTKARRVKWVPISFGLLLIVSSIGPWRVSNITKEILAEEITRSIRYPELFLDYASLNFIAPDAFAGNIPAPAAPLPSTPVTARRQEGAEWT